MDPVSLVALGTACVALPGLLGSAAFLRWRERRTAGARSEAWAAIAGDRGLRGAAWDVDGERRIRYGGAIRGRRVHIATPAPVPGWTQISFELDPPLDLGLRLQAEPRTMRRVPAFEAREAARARALLASERVTAALPALREFRWNAGDFAVQIDIPMTFPAAQVVDVALAAGLDLVAAIDVARAEVPLAGALEDEEDSWARAARQAGLAVGRLPLSMSGAMEDVAVAAYSFVRSGAGFGMGAQARFTSSLAGAIGLVPTSVGALEPWLELDPSHLAAEDWEVGDARFDAAFVVRSREPARLAAILPPALRRRLVHLHERTPLYLDDHAIRAATSYLLPARRIPLLLRQLAEVAVEVETNVRGRGVGPYR